MDTSQPKSLTIPPEVKTFLEGIMTDANLTTLDQEMRDEMVKELFARLDAFVTSKLVEGLPPEQLESFMKMADEGKSKEETQAFLTKHLPNAPEFFANAFGEFRDLYLGNVALGKHEEELKHQDKKDLKSSQ